MDISKEYQRTIDFLYEQLPMFSRQGSAALKPDLTNTLRLCEALNQPQNRFQSIHIAGTNGKGSTSHMLAAALQKSGYKTGLYTSPHLIDFRERIRIDGEPVSQKWVVEFVAQHRQLITDIQPSFFEITVAMAFQAFADNQVDIAVIETGLGGRVDSTNVITPILSVITNISYDHTDLLGSTLAEIAREKAGIIKQYVPVVIGQQHKETVGILFEQALQKHSPVYYAESLWELVKIEQDEKGQHFKAVNHAEKEIYSLHCDLTGAYQKYNITTALAAIGILNYQGVFKLPFEIAVAALGEVKTLTGLRGRWEILQRQPLIVADVAHNPAGLEEVTNQWLLEKGKTKHIVIGFVKDKDIKEALALFPKNAVYHFCQANVPRALPVDSLKKTAAEMGLKGTAYPTVADAVKAARACLNTNDALLITGSFFTVGEAIEYLSVESSELAAPAE